MVNCSITIETRYLNTSIASYKEKAALLDGFNKIYNENICGDSTGVGIMTRCVSLIYNLLYVSSSTGSNQSVSPGVRAKCTNQLSFVAPCQCFTFGGILTTSPVLSN
jgi:hypothetical protein